MFISHDLSVVRHIADHVMVMYLGRAVEMGTRDALFSAPQHPYTRALMSATPQADPDRVRQRIILQGELPSPFAPPPGCTFHPRCALMKPVCRQIVPTLESKEGRAVACFAVPGADDEGTLAWHRDAASSKSASAESYLL